MRAVIKKHDGGVEAHYDIRNEDGEISRVRRFFYIDADGDLVEQKEGFTIFLCKHLDENFEKYTPIFDIRESLDPQGYLLRIVRDQYSEAKKEERNYERRYASY